MNDAGGYQRIQLDVDDGVAWITFNLPRFGNALDLAGVEEAVEETTAMEIRNVLRSLEDPAFADRLRAFLRHEAKSDHALVDL